MTTAIPSALQILVPHGSSRTHPGLVVEATRTRRPEFLTRLVDLVDTPFGVPVPCTTRERTIVDLLRDALGIDAIESTTNPGK